MKPRWIRDALFAAVAVFAIAGEAPHASKASAVSEAAVGGLGDLGDAVARASASLSANVRTVRGGPYLGFDTNIYPGDEAMRAWRHDKSPYDWVGYYLPAPCHRDDTWSGKRETLQDMGWGLAVIYVGQQAWGQIGGKAARRSTPASRCSARYVSAARGTGDALDAIGRTAAEGFPRGTTIYLDVERMENVPRAMRDYYRAWTAKVLADGRFRPGVYAHTHNAPQIYADVRAVYDAAGVTDEPPFWVAGKTAQFARTKNPEDVGHQFAGVWQGVLDIVETQNGVKLPIDVSVASVPSPSDEYAVAEE